MRLYLTSLVILAFLQTCDNTPSPPATSPSLFTARGNEPGWRLDITDREITLIMDNGTRRVTGPPSPPSTIQDGRRYVSTADGKPLTATIRDRLCSDTMTGIPHPNTVTVLFDGRELRGCGGDPASLLQGEWIIQELNDVVVAQGAPGTLSFSPDGRLSGRSFCNSFSGAYTLTGESLTISQVAATLMACEPALMDQEKLFHELLREVRRFEAEAQSVTLRTAASQGSITLRRP
jgi:heat shock protein HslJ/uncharacterized membrane protein